MTRTATKDDFAMGWSDFAIGSRNATGSNIPLPGAGLTLTNRKQEGEEQFQLPPDGFVHLVAEGEFPVTYKNADGKNKRIVQVVDEASLDAMIANWEPDRLLNYDHHAHYQDKSSRAGGWIQEIEKRPGGIWGRIRWSNRGRSDVEGGDYRYISPEFDAGTAQQLDGDRVRITRLIGAALTNSPNMKTLTPLTNRRENHEIQSIMNEKLLNRIRRFFGLAEDANEDAIAQAIPEETNLAGLNDEVTRLNNRESELLGELADQTLADLDLDDKKRGVLRKGLIENRESTLALIEALPVKKEDPPEKKPLFNRAGATPPGGEEFSDSGGAKRASVICNRADEIYKAAEGNMSFPAAFAQAQAEYEEAKK